MVASELRPTIKNPVLWFPERPKRSEWRKLRKVVLDRDKNTCRFCGHRASKWMNIHHIDESEDNHIDNLITCCVACHAVLHFGLNMMLGKIEIWESDLSQVEIVQRTRDELRTGKTLDCIKAHFPLVRGKFAPGDISWANELIGSMKSQPTASLDSPLCAIFVDLKRWQLDCEIFDS